MENFAVEWDDKKNEENRRKHKIDFATAAHIFEDPYRIEKYDFEHSIDEDRYISIGLVRSILTVVHTERGDKIRLISARKADKKEVQEYYGQTGYERW